ncbi:MAG: SDR family NAD(P)-dependent oxidoreductase [Chloroflexi bacterium]|nr:SDR family NAD(P)-dependent oxidoreductase [Chloroflexota bacterium]
MNTSNNTVLITGGASGIGLALAKKFMGKDNRVIVTGRDREKLAQVQAVFPKIIAHTADMSRFEDVEQLAHRFTDVNILINNAGVQFNYDFTDSAIPLDYIKNELQTNLIGPLLLIKLMLPHLMTKQTAAIVNVSSGLGIVPKQSAPVYCGSKAGLHLFTKSLRWQLEDSNIKVFEIIPPIVDTAMTQGRGKGKISPETLAQEFWSGFQNDKYEMAIGRTKLLVFIHHYLPELADRIMRSGL